MAGTVSTVAEVASSTAAAAQTAQHTAGELNRLADDMKLLVGGFKH